MSEQHPEPSTERCYETSLCCLRCDRQGFVLTVGEAKIQGDRFRLQRWRRTVTRYVERFLQSADPLPQHRVTVDGETYVFSNLQLFDLFTALVQVENLSTTAPLPVVLSLGGAGFALGTALTLGLLPRSPAVEVAQPLVPLESRPEEPAPPPAAALKLPPATEKAMKAPPALPPPTPIRVTPRPPAPPTLAETLEETSDRPAPQPLPLPVAELPPIPEVAARRAEPTDPTPRLQAHLQATPPPGRAVLRLTWQPNQPPLVTVESTTLSPAAIARLRQQIEDWSRQNPSGYQGITRLQLIPEWNDSEPAAGATTTPASPLRSSDPPETPPPVPAAN